MFWPACLLIFPRSCRHDSFTELLGAWRSTGNPVYAQRFNDLVDDWVVRARRSPAMACVYTTCTRHTCTHTAHAICHIRTTYTLQAHIFTGHIRAHTHTYTRHLHMTYTGMQTQYLYLFKQSTLSLVVNVPPDMSIGLAYIHP